MTDNRKQEIITELQAIAASFVGTEEETELSMFRLISQYNATGANVDLGEDGRLIVGGAWVVENCPEPLSLLN